MSVIEELIRGNKEGGIDFGNYELAAKTKRSDYEYKGGLYKVKTYRDLTRLEKNEAFLYESEPGSVVTNLQTNDQGMTFSVEAENDLQITVELEENTEYEVYIDGTSAGTIRTNLGGKLSLSVEITGGEKKNIEILRK